MRDAQRARSEPTRYDRRCVGRQDEVAVERASGMAAVVRLRMPDGTVPDELTMTSPDAPAQAQTQVQGQGAPRAAELAEDRPVSGAAGDGAFSEGTMPTDPVPGNTVPADAVPTGAVPSIPSKSEPMPT